jgi:hypothetical protein
MPVARWSLQLEDEDFPPICEPGSLSYTESTVQKIQVGTGTSDSSISFGGVTTAQVFYITSDYAVSYKLNGGTTSHTVTANGHHMLIGAAITAVTISNASGSTANVLIILLE